MGPKYYETPTLFLDRMLRSGDPPSNILFYNVYLMEICLKSKKNYRSILHRFTVLNYSHRYCMFMSLYVIGKIINT